MDGCTPIQFYPFVLILAQRSKNNKFTCHLFFHLQVTLISFSSFSPSFLIYNQIENLV
jgi:hypothetical protein